MGMVTTGKLTQCSPGFHRHLAVCFRCQRQDHFCCINRRVQHRLTFGRAVRFGVIEFTQQIHFSLGIPGDPFPAVTDLIHQRTDGGKAFVGRRIITFNRNNVRCSFARNQVAFTFFPVLNVERLRQFGGRIVLDGQRHNICFHAQMADTHFREFLRDIFIDIPVTFRIPCRVNCGRQRVNKRMHIRGIHVVFLIPGRGWQHDIGVQAGTGQTEVQRHHQIQLAVETIVFPLDFFWLHAALFTEVFALNTVIGTEQIFQHVLMAFTGRSQQVRAPDEQVTRMVFTVFWLFSRKTNRAVLQRFDGVIHRRHARFFRFFRNAQRVSSQLWCRRQPAHAFGTHVKVDQMTGVARFIRHRRQQFLRCDGFVTPLAGVVIEVRGAVHVARRTLPVKAKRQRLPAGLRTQFFLAHIVCPAATALADTATEHQHIDQTAIVHIEVIPVVQTGTHDNH